ncbi:MAG: SpoIID/LytB domain-containing protein [Oscillospiraceae bacterium]|nr:SpoIID/LytB domain-containing protein [Oscillospiraceae bacterium]
MKKILYYCTLLVLLMASFTVSASAVTNDVVKVGLYYGSNSLYSANAQVVTGLGDGFELGYYDEARQFVSLGYIEENSVSVTPDGSIAYGKDGEITSGSGQTVLGGWHVQIPETYPDFATAQQAADARGGYVACVDGVFYVRVGSYLSEGEAVTAAVELGGTVVGPSATGVTVTARAEQRILFQFDYKGWYDFALQACRSGNEPTQTWFKAKKYYGGFQYRRVSGSNSLYVYSVVGLEDYIKCVVPYEMSNSWPLEALKAQAICARTYVTRVGERHSKYGFDVCNSEDCQVYFGVDFQYNDHTTVSDEAVEATAGLCMYYEGKPIYAVYSASNGGASEDAKNIWSTEHPYLKGKADPYEASIANKISGYNYSVSYTASSLGSRLASRYSGYKLGTLASVYVSEYTPNGNVYSVTFVDQSGKTYTVKGETCRIALGTKSQRFTINGGNATRYFVNEGDTIASIGGSYVIGGDGSVSVYNDTPYVITSAGVEEISSNQQSGSDIANGILIEGTGNGHNVGMSQWGANAMAKQGYSYRDILNFYYTGITIQ